MSTMKSLHSFAAIWALICVSALVLLAGFYWWLTWPDEHFWQVCASAAWALILIAVAACMVRIAFAAPESGLLSRPTAMSCTAVALWLVVFAVLELVLVALYEVCEAPAVRIAQLLHLAPRLVIALLHGTVCALIWLIVPALLLPIGASVTRAGFRGVLPRGLMRALRGIRYWAGLGISLGLFYAAHRLIDWLPERRTLHGELVSAGWRLGIAFVIAVTAVTLLVWSTPRVPIASEGTSLEGSSAGA